MNIETIDQVRPKPALQICQPTVRQVASLVSGAFGVTVHDIMGPGRRRDIVEARCAVVWLARSTLARSMPQIGRALGGRNHSSIYWALHKAEALRDADAEFQSRTNALLDECRRMVRGWAIARMEARHAA